MKVMKPTIQNIESLISWLEANGLAGCPPLDKLKIELKDNLEGALVAAACFETAFAITALQRGIMRSRDKEDKFSQVWDTIEMLSCLLERRAKKKAEAIGMN